MALYDGSPRVILEGNVPASLAAIGAAKKVLAEVQGIRKASGATTYSKSVIINDSVAAFVFSSMGTHVINLVSEPSLAEKETFIDVPTGDSAPTAPMDMYSGYVTNGIIDTIQVEVDGETQNVDVLREFRPTSFSANRHDELSLGPQAVTRLAVQPHAGFGGDLSSGSEVRFSQYSKLNSGMYSGTMRKAVQAVMGYGRLSIAQLSAIAQSTPAITPNVYNIFARSGVQIRYDYRWIRTHGLHRGADGTWWLVEISILNGIIARPLPIIAGTDSAGFREGLQNAGKRDLLEVVDQLGGLPTGEAFPPGQFLREAIEEGSVIRLKEPSELSNIYGCQSYSSAMGWTFNESGNTAHNTCYLFKPDKFKHSRHYSIQIDIGPINSKREKGQRIASGIANIRLEREDRLYGNGTIGRYANIKIYEPLVGYMISVDMAPERGADINGVIGNGPPINALIAVVYINNSLRKIFQYADFSPGLPPRIINDLDNEPCNPPRPGTYVLTIDSSSRRVPQMAYTSDKDDRQVWPTGTFQQVLQVKGAGHTPYSLTDLFPQFDYSRVFRFFKLGISSTTNAISGINAGAAVAMLGGDRNMYFYAEGNISGQDNFSYSTSRGFIRDPYTYVTWRFIDPPGAVTPGVPSSVDPVACDEGLCGGNHAERRVICEEYSPSLCNQPADAGPYFQQCDPVPWPNDNTEVFEPTSFSQSFAGRGSAKAYFYGDGVSSPVPLADLSPNRFFGIWMRPSPDPETRRVDNIFAVISRLGAPAARVQMKINAAPFKVIGIIPGGSNVGGTFVGVNGP